METIEKRKIIFFTKEQEEYENVINKLRLEGINVLVKNENVVETILDTKPEAIIIASNEISVSMTMLESIKDEGSINDVPKLFIGPYDKKVKIRALSLGALHYISTPVDEEELFYKIRNTLQVYKNILKNNIHDSLTGMYVKKYGQTVAENQKVKTYVKTDNVMDFKETKLLIVDDDKIILSMLSARYRNKGYKVYSVNDPREALKLFKDQHFDIIISDYYMQTMQADEFITEIRKNSSDVRIIILSGQKNEVVIQRALSLGADDYITKPFSPVELDLRIRRFVR